MSAKSPRYQGCNVLAVSAEGRRLWQFNVGKDKVAPAGDLTLEPGKPLPKAAVARDWRQLVKPKLNLAWLPLDHVFIRAVQLPAASAAELPGMVEFQLEKLSPLPPAQVVWTVEAVPHADGTQQTALVVIASRAAVEEYLGLLEQGGYVADQLELPLLRELKTLRPEGDGLWILVEPGSLGSNLLVGWFVNGIWQEVSLLRLTSGAAGSAQLIELLTQNAWGGELNGWLKGLPEVHLVAQPEAAAELEGLLRDWSGRPVVTQPRRPVTELAELGALHHLPPPASSLVPPEVTKRRRDRFIDALWMKGLGTAGVAYLAFVFLYMVALKVQEYRFDNTRDEANAMAQSYTNALQLKAQVAVLQDQVGLRFAALDSWRAAVEHLPETVTLTQLDFSRGRSLELTGTVANESTADVTKFNSELKKVEIDGQPLFAKVEAAQINSQPGAAFARWSFKAELKRTEGNAP
ncbi:MAG TPA: hypothetical protein VMB21_13750 [Candidatus Limnocylindria bacterium]|jgi:hypothetical protein|nr:hypothetical protein [Candidatus Limnocylindria bacterium]